MITDSKFNLATSSIMAQLILSKPSIRYKVGMTLLKREFRKHHNHVVKYHKVQSLTARTKTVVVLGLYSWKPTVAATPI